MTIQSLSAAADGLRVTWGDGNATTYPTIWLRDNCPSGFHPQTHERVLDLLALAPSPILTDAQLDDGGVILRYADGHISNIPTKLLHDHRPGQRAHDPAAIQPQLWRAEMTTSSLPRHGAAEILAHDQSLQSWMQETARYGIAMIDQLENSTSAGTDVAKRIGFLRKTNFGTTFEVVNKPDPNNLAYTSVALPLHTDLPNQEVPPGYQFLHCLANEATGGGSIFADGFAMAEDLRSEDPEAFQLLCDVPIPFRFSDQTADIRVYEPVITLDNAGNVIEIRYNAHLAEVFDMPSKIMADYYRAYRAFMAKTRDPKYRLRLRLQAGEMVAFDNRRVLHGRDAFDPSTGFRHLHGCYVDRGEFASRLRLLAT
ncbi:gamma-butyrobetaine hydroxylase [Loktanella sp. D2R18]|uniref:TauD/TfdA family dioxygenase n=1 Tax=Rhodobacterales TaxID=204455 RepID=UPI000DEB5168|nr:MULTISPECIES: TauD/TfdA family dioxygenase [Rhodobacterales]MDO6592051.1 TauD/TfdA family dioxygenase [Yoonia sp. 1_MG-2023]RBW44817.1 gamma-butyrobetaine hydroxylase [Loktanella sp. D2R18]